MSSIRSVSLTVQGSQFGDLGPSFNGTEIRTKVLLTELMSKRKQLLDKQVREKLRHRNRGKLSPRKQYSENAAQEHMSSMASLSSSADISHLYDINSVNSRALVSQGKSNYSVSSPYNRSKYSVSKGNSSQLIDDQNMTLFTSNTRVYCKKLPSAPILKPLTNSVPVIFPHYEPKVINKESHSKAFKDKIAEVMMLSTQYGRIERPYLFSLLKQSGGAANLQIKTKSGQEIIADGYKKIEEERKAREEADRLANTPASNDNENQSDFNPDPNSADASQNRRIAFSVVSNGSRGRLGQLTNFPAKPVGPPIFDLSIPRKLLDQSELEQQLGSIDQERLAYQLQNHVNATKHEEHFPSRADMISMKSMKSMKSTKGDH